MKKPIYKRWTTYLYAFLAIVLIGIFTPETKEDTTDKAVAETPTAEELAQAEAEAEAQAKKDAEASARIAEITKKNEAEAAKKAEADAKAKAAADAQAKADAEAVASAMGEAYERFIAESDGVIVSIEPEDDFEIVNVRLTDDFAYLPVALKQQFVDDFGGRIEANTRATMFEGRGSSDFIYVYFVNSRGEHLVETKHLDRGWKAK